jgi:thiosulfate/3-mercaptopyruvate sulfurtransferase
MKTKIFFILLASILIASLLPCGFAFAWHYPPSSRMIDPIVSTDWLLQNIDNENLVIIDIRDPASYAEGHIPGAINEPFVTGFDPCLGPISNWIIGSDDCLWLELPNEADLFNTIGNLGITHDSRVVIVTAPSDADPAPFYGLANATRVALTLIYAGVVNVAILDGGYPKWLAEPEKLITTDVPEVTPVLPYEGHINEGIFVSLNYVRWQLYKADLIDARDAIVYYGAATEPFAPEAGHIPGAASLPAPWIWNLNTDGTYTFKDIETLGDMASGVIWEPRRYRDRWRPQIIVYCGVGGYASSWWFVLTQVLGYQNVKFYDGSAQEWVMEGYKMVPYRWD